MFALFLSAPSAFGDDIDLVRVVKSDRVMQLLAQGKVVREYRISLGEAPVGDKVREGDERTPEGHYVLDWRNPESRFFRSIRISYPNEEDKAQARQAGVSPGGDIFIHGLPTWAGMLNRAFEGRDWTDGCIAVNDNRQMLEIWNLVKDGTPIRIQP